MLLDYVVALGSFIRAGAIAMCLSARRWLPAVPSCAQRSGSSRRAATSLSPAAVPLPVTGNLKTAEPRSRG